MAATILVVEDEEPILNLVVAYLQAEGFAVRTARDGMQALAEARSARPDLVVLDLLLPTLDGLEVCRRLQQEGGPYVLMLTARAEEVDKVVGLSVGADDYLTKPFSPRELVARVCLLYTSDAASRRSCGAVATLRRPKRNILSLSSTA